MSKLCRDEGQAGLAMSNIPNLGFPFNDPTVRYDTELVTSRSLSFGCIQVFICL